MRGWWWIILMATGTASAQITVRSGTGANPAAIQAVVDQFRTDLGGANNGVGVSSSSSGRREINWDATPMGFSAPNTLPGNFFNQNSQRGCQLTVQSGGTGFMVSDLLPGAGSNNAGVRFDNLNNTYSAQFQTFSAQKLFTALGNRSFDITFFVPKAGSAEPGSVRAGVRGFGAVFADVDQAGTTALQFFDQNEQSIGAFAVSPANLGLSFLGAFTPGPAIYRVRVTPGNAAVGPNDSAATDIVVMDDFVYGEPVTDAMFADRFE